MACSAILKVRGRALVDRSGARQAPSRVNEQAAEAKRGLAKSDVPPFLLQRSKRLAGWVSGGFSRIRRWFVSVTVESEVWIMFGIQRRLQEFLQANRSVDCFCLELNCVWMCFYMRIGLSVSLTGCALIQRAHLGWDVRAKRAQIYV